MRIITLSILTIFLSTKGYTQTVKILFDATKAETASNADWVIDEDLNNMTWNPNATVGSGSEGNAQRYPTPAQSTITSSTPETYWKGAISAWGIDCVKQGYTVETLPYNGAITYGNSSNAQDLSNYKIYIVCEPNILFTAAEKTAIINFVQNGGSLFMVSDHINSDRNNDTYDSPEIWNDLLVNNSVKSNPFGILFDSASFSQTTSNIPNLPNDSLLNGPMGSVTQAMWSSGTSITISPAVNTSVKGIVYQTGSSFGNTGVMFAYSRYGKGKIAAIGDSSPCDDGTGDTGDNSLYNGWTTDAAGNHERLIMNATIWLATKDSFVAPAAVKDIAFDSLVMPKTLQLGNNIVSIRFKNTGNTIIDSVTASYKLGSNAAVSVLLTGLNLAPNNLYTYNFTTPVNISTPGNYTICSWVKTIGDNNASNDSLCNAYTIPFVFDVATDSIISPQNIVKGNNTVTVRIKNLSNTILDSITLGYQWNAMPVQTVSLHSLNIAVNSTYTYTFLNEFNVTADGTYKLYVWNNSFGDLNYTNDTIVKNYVLNTTGILEEVNIKQATIFPNPFINTISITSVTPAVISIYNTEGKLILQKEISGNEILNTETFAKGFYFIEMKSENEVKHLKVFKE